MYLNKKILRDNPFRELSKSKAIGGKIWTEKAILTKTQSIDLKQHANSNSTNSKHKENRGPLTMVKWYFLKKKWNTGFGRLIPTL